MQRPKVDVYEGYLFVVLRLPRLDKGLVTEQLAIVLGDDFVITFGERSSECFEAVRSRLAPRAQPDAKPAASTTSPTR